MNRNEIIKGTVALGTVILATAGYAAVRAYPVDIAAKIETHALYTDLIEIAVEAYDDKRIEEYVREAEAQGVQEHGFPRLAANLAHLVANGRMTNRLEILGRMMTIACASAGKGKMPPKSGGNEFSVRELATAVVALEKTGVYPRSATDVWRAGITAVVATNCYTSGLTPLGQPTGRNWPLFGAASEQARIKYGMGGDHEYVERWVLDQLRHFDSNGMYRDPHEPTVYDFVGRMLYMQILHFGYDGPCRAKIEEKLLVSAEPTLAMLSVCGEIPYGGRSNQFLHNNTLYAAVAEWYAAFFARRGDEKTANRFKAAAKHVIEAIKPWYCEGQIFHVKNRYPRPTADGKRNIEQRWFGCEPYAYFDKYMITMGSWAALASEFSSTKTRLSSEPGQSDGGWGPAPTFQTSDHFHWKFTHSASYTVQEDWNANPKYDATGIGRIHRRGAPPAICLSVPFAEKPNYDIGGGKNPGPMAITGWKRYSVSDTGVELLSQGKPITLPAYEFDGEDSTIIEFSESLMKIHYRGWVCRYEVRDGKLIDTGLTYHNRNGRYRRIDACGEECFSVFVSIEKDGMPDAERL